MALLTLAEETTLSPPNAKLPDVEAADALDKVRSRLKMRLTLILGLLQVISGHARSIQPPGPTGSPSQYRRAWEKGMVSFSPPRIGVTDSVVLRMRGCTFTLMSSGDHVLPTRRIGFRPRSTVLLAGCRKLISGICCGPILQSIFVLPLHPRSA